MSRNVFVFGAGVSKPAGFPLARDLTPLLREWLPEASVSTWDALVRQGLFGPDDNLEISLTQLDLQIASRSLSNDSWETADEEFKRLWAFRNVGLPFALRDLLSNRHDSAASEKGRLDYLKNFVDRHVKPGDTVITFNYDVLPEFILRQKGKWRLRDGYGVDMSGLFPALRSEEESPCQVLKLHGSLGWLSPTGLPGQLWIQPPFLKYLGYPELDGKFKVTADWVDDPAILPSFLKNFWLHPLPTIWYKAAQALRQAARIAFIGYSFPAADAAAVMLFLTNAIPGQEINVWWYSNADLARVSELGAHFFEAGIKISEAQSSIEGLSHTEAIWFDTPELR